MFQVCNATSLSGLFRSAMFSVGSTRFSPAVLQRKKGFSLNLTNMPSYIHTFVLHRITECPLDVDLKKIQT